MPKELFNLLQVYTRKIPFSRYKQEHGAIFALIKGEAPGHPDSEATSDAVPENIWDMITKCWDRRPESRPTCDEIRSIHLDAGASAPVANPQMIADRDAFWDAVLKAKSSHHVDYERVLRILRHVCNFSNGEVIAVC